VFYGDGPKAELIMVLDITSEGEHCLCETWCAYLGDNWSSQGWRQEELPRYRMHERRSRTPRNPKLGVKKKTCKVKD
jgi:hypothetical protein